jgi:Leucine-rich repeat (LRR) protein
MSIEGFLSADNHIEAITPRDPEQLVAQLQSSFGMKKVHKTARQFIESTAGVSLIKGPFRVRGMGSIDVGEIGDLSLPALPVGGTEGCDFWLMLDSGRVSTQRPADGGDPTGELDVTQLVALQTALFEAFGEEDPPRGPKFIRVVARCLGGLPKLAKLHARLRERIEGGQPAPLPFVADIDAKLLADMVAADRRWASTLRKDPAEVRVIDFSHAHLTELPPLEAFDAVEVIDLRHNPELDPQSVFEALAPLERLIRVDVSLSHWQQEHVEALRELLPACRVVDETPRGAPTIVAALRTGKVLTELDLSGLDLRRLPRQMRELSELEVLDLSGNHRLEFEMVFAQLASLKKLRCLDLRACGLRKLSPVITKLEALEELDLTSGTWGNHNRLEVSEVLPVVAELPNLRRLTLDGARLLPGQWRATMRLLGDKLSGLTHLGMAGWSTLENSGRMFGAEIQQTIAKMGNLESVKLGALQLTAMEPALEELPLRRLDISQNDVSTIAPAQLESLEELVARGTSLSSLEGLERCRKLRLVDVAGPRGAQRTFAFPDWLDWLGELRTLRVENLAFERVPPSIGALQHLEELVLSSKTLATLPDEVGELSALRSLVLHDLVGGCERLEALPDTLGNLQQLTRLRVSHGGLRRLPEAISDCKALRDMELDGLSPADPMDTMTQLAQLPLERLSVSFSGLTRLPEALADCETLRNVRILGGFQSYAQAARVICSLPNLERVDLSRFALAGLPAAFSECKSLRALHYETPRTHTVLSPEVLFSALARLPHFQELSIDDIAGHWRELPSSIGELARLEKLTLTAVSFGKLPKEIGRLHNLRLLHFDRCPAIRAGELKRLRRALPDCEIRVTDW